MLNNTSPTIITEFKNTTTELNARNKGFYTQTNMWQKFQNVPGAHVQYTSGGRYITPLPVTQVTYDAKSLGQCTCRPERVTLGFSAGAVGCAAGEGVDDPLDD